MLSFFSLSGIDCRANGLPVLSAVARYGEHLSSPFAWHTSAHSAFEAAQSPVEVNRCCFLTLVWLLACIGTAVQCLVQVPSWHPVQIHVQRNNMMEAPQRMIQQLLGSLME